MPEGLNSGVELHQSCILDLAQTLTLTLTLTLWLSRSLLIWLGLATSGAQLVFGLLECQRVS